MIWFTSEQLDMLDRLRYEAAFREYALLRLWKYESLPLGEDSE